MLPMPTGRLGSLARRTLFRIRSQLSMSMSTSVFCLLCFKAICNYMNMRVSRDFLYQAGAPAFRNCFGLGVDLQLGVNVLTWNETVLIVMPSFCGGRF